MTSPTGLPPRCAIPDLLALIVDPDPRPPLGLSGHWWWTHYWSNAVPRVGPRGALPLCDAHRGGVYRRMAAVAGAVSERGLGGC